MSVQKPGISYSSQRVVANKGKKIVLASNNGSSKGTGVGATTSTPSKTASANLATATRSTAYTRVKTSSDVGNVATSNFKLAARSNTMALYSNTFDYSALRSNLNRNTGFVGNQMSYTAPSAFVQRQDNSMNKFAAAMMAMQVLQQGLGALGSLNSSADVKGGGNVKQGGNTGTSGDASKSSGIDQFAGMKNADTSAALSAAIDSAKAEQADIPKRNSQLQDTFANLKGQTDGLKKASDEAQAKLDKNTDDISKKSQEVTQQENTVKSYQDTYDASEKSYLQAQSAYEKAPDMITEYVNGKPVMKPNPQKTELKIQAESAKVKMETARKNLEKAENDLNNLKGELEDLKGQTKGLEQTAGDAKDAYDKNLKDIKSTQAEIEQLTEKKTKLDSEIPKQEERLKKLQEKEDKELSSIDGKIGKAQEAFNKLSGSINVNDANGLSDKEMKTKAKADEKQTEIEQLKQRKADLNKMREMRNYTTEVVGGTQFKTGYSGGEKIYVTNGEIVSKEDYDKAMEKAKKKDNPQNS